TLDATEPAESSAATTPPPELAATASAPAASVPAASVPAGSAPAASVPTEPALDERYGSPVRTFFSDTVLIFRRQLMLSVRNPAWVIIGLIQPILYLAFFGPLLSRVARGGGLGVPAHNPYSFFVPGLLIQLGLFGAAFVGFTIIADWRAGVIERFRV